MMPGFICSHVSAGAPILYASHDEPIDEDDSGWQLMCGAEDHVTADFLVVNVERYATLDETLRDLLSLPVNTTALRVGKDQPWVIEQSS